MSFDAFSERWRSRIEQRLEEVLEAGEEPLVRSLEEAMRYSVLGGGKRFRPLLCLACCEAVGGAPTDALDPACGIELIHCFSLVHDDLPCMDDDDYRRGKPSCHKQFGEAVALLAGDALLVRGFECVAGAEIEAGRRVRALKALCRAIGVEGMVGGQMGDIAMEGVEADFETVRWIHERKTGALIAASCEIGALVGGGSEEQVAAAREYGSQVGLAFQIRDDLLDLSGTVSGMGKRPGGDLKKEKATYPGVVGVATAERLMGEAVDRAVSLAEGMGESVGVLREFALLAVERTE
ncbi:MAG: polyprenyl synthetase family protein [Armatimonadetes bacterium]|nr:MAG: polyprenyl synthetase family protein [Armatimonadota bacterium]